MNFLQQKLTKTDMKMNGIKTFNFLQCYQQRPPTIKHAHVYTKCISTVSTCASW